MSTTYRSRADQSAADDMNDRGRLMCSAHGCPNLWSTSDGNLCHWHADADPSQWPQVTREAQDHITDRAHAAGMNRPTRQALPMTMDEKRAIADRLRIVLEHSRKNPRAWIDRLNAKVAVGIPLTAAQKHALACVPMQFMKEAA